MNQALDARAQWLCALLWVAAFIAPASTAPMTLFANQWLAVIGWGILLCAATGVGTVRSLPAAAWAMLGLLAALAAAAATQQHWLDALLLLMAAGVFASGVVEDSTRPLRTLWWALLVGGLASALIGSLQTLVPHAAGSVLIANVLNPGRAAGNLRQPNLLATLLALAFVALVAVSAARAGSRPWAMAAAAMLGGCLEFSASRTGSIELCVAVVWVVSDRRLPRGTRSLAAAAVFGFVAGAGLQWLAAASGEGAFFARERLTQAGGGTHSRLSIWSDVLVLIGREPWTGVGWGNLSRAWALSEFPERHPAAFDNAHNIVLQLAVELGVPGALACLCVLAFVLWRARYGLQAGDVQVSLPARTCAAMLLLLGVHSLLEYPLWYAFFLMPAAYMLGALVRQSELARPATAGSRGWPWHLVLQGVGVAVVFGALSAAWDFARVLQVYSPFGRGLRQPFEQRVAEGRRSPLFGALADYGMVTTAEHPGSVLEAFDRPVRYLVNPRLLLAYARALEERGEHDRARYVAARLREFHSPVGDEFFAACSGAAPAAPLPFQCEAPTPSTLTYKNFP